MLNNNNFDNIIKTPEQELGEFKKAVESNIQHSYGGGFETLSEQKQIEIVKKALEQHKEEMPTRIEPEYIEKSKEAEEIVLHLSPDKDDEKMNELLGLMEKVGILNTITTIEKTESFHILDDFHRLLVQYIKSGYKINIKENSDIYPGLNMVLFEVKLPLIDKEEDKGKKMEELLSSMEQFYSGMFGIAEIGKENYFSIEISYPEGKEQISFFCSVPDDKSGLFKNQVLAIFSDAKLKEVTDDYNIFNRKKHVAGSYLNFKESNFLPIRTYKDLNHDPINIILKSFSNLDTNEGASIQIILSPAKEKINRDIDKALDKIRDGKKIKSVLKGESSFFQKTISSFHEAIFGSSDKSKNEDKIKEQEKRNIVVEQLKNKNSSRMYEVNIRLITSGKTDNHAEIILQEIESAFLQFENINGNNFVIRKIKKKDIVDFVKKYTFRIFDKKFSTFLNITELTSIFHFPRQRLQVGNIMSTSTMSVAEASSKIKMLSEEEGGEKWDKEKKLNSTISKKQNSIQKEQENNNEINNYSANKNIIEKKENDFLDDTDILKKHIQENSSLSGLENMGDSSLSDGKKIILGVNEYQGVETPVYLKPLDRMRHMYMIGQTGTGKTTLMKNMIVQDIKNGDGICFIDPHGSDIEDILASIPKERAEDVIYFDPADLERPMGLNMLEYDPRYPEQKSFVVNELLAIFEKLFDMKKNGSGGPMFEMYFRNATLLALDDPAKPATLYDIVRVLSDKEYRSEKLKKSTNITVNQFWTKIAEQAGGEASMENVVPYITSKFDGFLSNDYMRPIVSQEKSVFNFRDIMDNKKILLINLSKGRLGELNANLLGLIIVGKILMAALSRVDSLHLNLPPFYLYIDEFQNVTTDSISQILSEARKYKLSLNIAHQYIKQIDEGIKDAIFGNVGSMVTFRVGPEDAEFLEKQFAPTFTAKDIASIDNRNAYLKLLADGEPQTPFNIRTLAPEIGNPSMAEYIKKISREKYGKDRIEIEEEIRKKISFL